MPSAGRLRSTGIAPLQRYYAPLRLPIRSAGPLCVPGLRSGYDPDRAGLSGFHALVRGVPSVATPGSRSAAHRLFTDRVGFTLSGGLTAPIFAYRGHSVRLRYGPPLRLPRLRPGIAAVTARAATCVVERSHGQLLSSVESTWPCLTHQRKRRAEEEGGVGKTSGAFRFRNLPKPGGSQDLKPRRSYPLPSSFSVLLFLCVLRASPPRFPLLFPPQATTPVSVLS